LATDLNTKTGHSENKLLDICNIENINNKKVIVLDEISVKIEEGSDFIESIGVSSGGSSDLKKSKKQILPELYYRLKIPNCSINNLELIIEKNNIDITNSKYFKAYNQIKNNFPHKLSYNTNNTILTIIKNIESLKQEAQKQLINIIEYRKILVGFESTDFCEIIDINGLNKNTINHYINKYNQLIKNKSRNVKEIKKIFNNLLQ